MNQLIPAPWSYDIQAARQDYCGDCPCWDRCTIKVPGTTECRSTKEREDETRTEQAEPEE